MRSILGSRRWVALAIVLALAAGVDAKSRKGDKAWKEGRVAEDRRDYDKALDLYEKALNEEPGDAGYLLGVRRVRFQAGQAHVDKGKKLRAQGQLEEALAEYQKAFAIDPSSSIAEQEIRRTLQMIEREKKRAAEPGQAEAKPEERGLTPAQQARKDAEEHIASAMPPPELKPMTPQISTLKMNNQPVKVLFETVGKLAGVNIVFDPDYQAPAGKNFSVDLVNVTLDDALDYVAVITKSFWKALSSNTVFVTNDNVTKRRDYEDHVVKVFYLQNVTTVQELQEIATNVRSITDIRRLFTYNSQNAIVVRATADQVALAEKLIQDLDKPKAEVIIDIIVMEANRSRSRSLAASLANGATPGIVMPIGFTPRNPVLSGTTTTSTDTTTGLPGTTTGSTTTVAGSAISLAQINKIKSNDFSLSLPGAFLQALMSDRSTRVLQSPQLRAADGAKATLKIGDRYPYATGSFGSGMGAVGVGISPLVSTQFQFAEVGVNADVTPRIHGANEVSLHVELEISSVRETIDVGGLKQPVIGQRRVIHDLRVREGEISVLGGLMQGQDLKTLSGFPGLANVPILKRLFSSEIVEKNASELLVVLIPHIIRSPEISEANLRGIAAGNDQTVKLNFAPRRQAPAPAVKPPAPAEPKPVAAEPKPAPAEPQPAALPSAPGLVVFTPSPLEAKPGATFTATLQANGVTDLYSALVRVKFDPQALKLIGVERGNLTAMDGQQPLFTRNIQSDAGEVSINITRLPGTGGVSGSGALATLTFQAVGRGATEIACLDMSLRNSQQQPVPAAPPKLLVTIQ
ncbi:MAG: cohesin domain-containing protein [Bryobacterales bacterium]|nr:cohesin domain-containing protein [Bryobacterales bacterium]